MAIVESGSGNVFADLGLPDAEEHLLKAKLVSRIDAIIRRRKLLIPEPRSAVRQRRRKGEKVPRVLVRVGRSR
jgi:hypothetical protein